MKAVVLLSKLHSAEIVLSATDGREIPLRRVAEPMAGILSLSAGRHAWFTSRIPAAVS